MLHLKRVDVDDLTEQVFAKASAIGDHDWRLAESATLVAELDPTTDHPGVAATGRQRREVLAAGVADRRWAAGCRIRAPLEFYVVDRGPGIPEGMEERIFERFGRVDARRGIQGSGLGLPIVVRDRERARRPRDACRPRRPAPGSRSSFPSVQEVK